MTTLLNLSFGLLVSLGLGAPRIGAAPLEVGADAPQFEVTDVDGKSQNLQQLLTHGPVVLVFFPSAGSPTCTQELQAFVSQAAQATAHGATVLAISASSTDKMQAFRTELKASFPFISDNKALLAGRYKARAVIIPQARRVTYVIDQNQHIAYAEEDADAAALKGVMGALQALGH